MSSDEQIHVDCQHCCFLCLSSALHHHTQSISHSLTHSSTARFLNEPDPPGATSRSTPAAQFLLPADRRRDCRWTAAVTIAAESAAANEQQHGRQPRVHRPRPGLVGRDPARFASLSFFIRGCAPRVPDACPCRLHALELLHSKSIRAPLDRDHNGEHADGRGSFGSLLSPFRGAATLTADTSKHEWSGVSLCRQMAVVDIPGMRRRVSARSPRAALRCLHSRASGRDENGRLTRLTPTIWRPVHSTSNFARTRRPDWRWLAQAISISFPSQWLIISVTRRSLPAPSTQLLTHRIEQSAIDALSRFHSQRTVATLSCGQQ